MAQETKNRVVALARKSNISEMDLLLKSENIQWTDCRYHSGDTPLHIAAQLGNVVVIRYLLNISGTAADTVNVTNLAGKTALHEACQNSQPDAVAALLSQGANARAIKQADWTPLMLACTKKGEKALACCRLLLEVGGPVLLDDRNKDGWDALHIAVREGDTKIVKELLAAVTDLEKTSSKSKNGRTPLHTAALHGCHVVVKQLLDINNVDCSVKDSCGSTPLHDAVRSGSLETFKVLVEAGADLTVINNEGYGILHMAAQTGQIPVLEHIIKEVGPTSSMCSKLGSKTTPLHCAVRAGQVQALRVLLKFGADPMILDSWGRSCYDIIPELASLP